MPKILVVEDEARIRAIIARYLQREGYTVVEAEDGVQALAALDAHTFDLAVLDILIPGVDGFTLCKIIRERSPAPIVFLSARQEEGDKLRGYALGADDYMTKPFSPGVLVAKIRALLRRAEGGENPAPLAAGEICLYPLGREVYVAGDRIALTHKEYELLALFMAHPGQVLSREQLLNRVWGFDFAGNTRTVDTHIRTLRAKLGPEGRHIVTLIRSGYKFEVSAHD